MNKVHLSFLRLDIGEKVIARIRYISLLILLFVLKPLVLSGQIMYKYSSSTGLPSTNIYALTFNNYGELHLATDNGLFSYDGFNFNLIPSSNRDILYSFTDSADRIWGLTSSAKLFYYKDGEVVNHSQIPLIPKRFQSIVTRSASNKDSIWISSGRTLFSFSLDLKNGFVREFAADGPIRSLWLADSNLYFCDFGKVYTLRNGKSKLLHDFGVVKIVDVKILKEEIYILTIDGLFKFVHNKPELIIDSESTDGSWIDYDLAVVDDKLYVLKSEQIFAYEGGHLNPFYSFPSKVTSFLKDKYGNYWISTLNDGLFRVPVKYSLVGIREKSQEHLPLKQVFTFMEDGTIVYGNNDGTISINNQIFRYSVREQCSVREIIVKDGWLFLATDGGLFQRSASGEFKKVLGEAIKKIILQDSIFISGSNYGLEVFRYDSEHGLTKGKHIFDKRVYTLTFTEDEIWFSSIEGYYQSKDDILSLRLDTLESVNGSCISIHSINDSFQLIIGGDQKVVVHNKYNSEIKATFEFDIDFKVNCSVQCLENNHEIWVSTNRGLFQLIVDTLTGNIRQGVEIPLDNRVFEGNVRYTQIVGDSIYFLCNNRVYCLNKHDFYSSPSVPIKIYSVNVDGQDRDFLRSILLQPGTEQVRIRLFDPSYRVLGFKYRFENDPNEIWTPLNGNTLFLEELTRGNHKLVFSAENGPNNTFPKIELKIIQKAVLREIPIVQFLLAFLILFIIGLSLYNRQINASQREKLEMELANTQANLKLIGLQSQMNPHFLRNCLNSIQSLIYQKQTKRASLFIGHFSQLIEQFLHQAKDNFTPIELELKLLTNFISLEKLRFSESFDYHESISDELPMDLEVPTMFLQPLLENSIEHGLLPSETEKKDLFLFIEFEGSVLEIYVIDNGVGIDLPEITDRKSIALDNIKNRIQMLNSTGEVHIEFDIHRGSVLLDSDIGTEAYLKILYFDTLT